MRKQWWQTEDGLPRHEAERLLVVATGRSRSQLISGCDLSAVEADRFYRLVKRRIAGEPLQYLEGTLCFGPLELRIDERAFIPRPETEQLFEWLSEILSGPDIIVDIATGSGNLALALKHDFLHARVFGCDIDERAISLARENSRVTNLPVEWLVGDLFDSLPEDLRGKVDVVVANPPYLSLGAHLPIEVNEHEPSRALFAGVDGLEILRRIAESAEEWLIPGGIIACEIGAEQGHAARKLFAAYAPEVGVDLAGRDRWVIGSRR